MKKLLLAMFVSLALVSTHTGVISAEENESEREERTEVSPSLRRAEETKKRQTEDESEKKRPTPSMRKDELRRAENEASQSERQQISAERCTAIKERLAERAENYQLRHDRHLSRYNHVIEIVTVVMERLQAAGQNTTALESVLNQLKTKIGEFKDASNLVSDQLKSLNEMSCEQLRESKAQLAEVEEKIKDIKIMLDSMHETQQRLKTELKQLRELVKSESNQRAIEE